MSTGPARRNIPAGKRPRVEQLIREGLTTAVIRERLGVHHDYISRVRREMKDAPKPPSPYSVTGDPT